MLSSRKEQHQKATGLPELESEYHGMKKTKQILILATGGIHLEPFLHSPPISDIRRKERYRRREKQ